MDNNLIGNQIAKFRKAKNMTQEELGRSVGVSTQAVSRWECGGAPDITLLPAIADRLGVTVDALFGRGGTEGLDMEKTVMNWFASMPQEQVFPTLHRLVFSAVTSHVPLAFPDIYLESCIEKDTNCLIRSNITTDHGVYFGVNAKDMGWAAICPKPEAGYQAFFCDNERYRSLFSTLATPGALEVLMYMLSHRNQFATAELLAKNTGTDVTVLEDVLTQLHRISIVAALNIDTMEGTTRVYAINEDGSYIPFFYLARHLTDETLMNYVDMKVHTKPLL